MRDKISIPIVAALHPKISDEVKERIEFVENKLGPFIAVRITQGNRSFAESDAMYKIGRTIRGANVRPGHPMGNIITNASAGESFHNYDLAIDYCILYDKDKNGTFESISWDLLKDMDRDGEADWKEVVDAFEAAGYEWGGDWKSIKDSPHLQKGFGFTWKQLLVKYNAGDFIPGTKYLNL
jgi:peptidoglycan L-alanyl-D-glutamate endopeptidase CwlK